MDRVLYIVNPAGHGGAGTVAWEEFRSLWADPIDPADVITTERAGHAREIAAAADCSTFVVVGGDGTVNETMSGILDADSTQTRVAIVPAGTGNDIARNVGIHSVEEAVRVLRDGVGHNFDLIAVDWTDGGDWHRNYSFLQAGVGFSGSTDVHPWMKRIFGATIAYYAGVLAAIVTYQPPRLMIRGPSYQHSGPVWLVVVGNSEWTSGGSMRMSPGARSDDGELNITVIPVHGSRVALVAKMLPKIASGQHIHQPHVEYFPGTSLEIGCDHPVHLDLDGELFEASEARFQVRAGAIRILTAGAAPA